MSFRTDLNNNPTAFTTNVAALGLVLGVDYVQGDPFPPPNEGHLYTAKLLGDPIAVTIKLLDKVGFRVRSGYPRWTYVDLLNEHWNSFSPQLKKSFIGLMYGHEGGTELKHLFL